MENQHRKIPGYRDLDADEIRLIARIKEAEAQILALHTDVATHLEIRGSRSREDHDRLCFAESWRWLSIAKTDLQTSFMGLIRAVAQPQPVEPREE